MEDSKCKSDLSKSATDSILLFKLNFIIALKQWIITRLGFYYNKNRAGFIDVVMRQSLHSHIGGNDKRY
jgi:hypothetical protein